jgi:CheY-like chemotaxis protein
MSSTTQNAAINIYFYELNEKDSGVIQRVIDFGKSQNKPFVLFPSLEQAHIIISSDAVLNKQGQAVHIKIGDSESAACNIFLKRPLLVTRVMRALDDAVHLIGSNVVSNNTPAIAKASVATTEAIPQTAEVAVDSQPVSLEQAPIVLATSEHAQTLSDTTAISSDSATANPVTSSSTEAAKAEPVTKAAIQQEIEDEQHYDYRALVVDDSAAIRKQLELELKASQIYPDFAETGEEALEKIQANQYDLIFLDIILPGIDGYEVCKTMRTKPNLKKTPIIMLSGKTSPLDEVKGVLAGASTYLTKPVKHEQFQQTLKRVAKWLSVFAANPAS